MNEISCEICMDLIPLVQDGIASEDSKKAVERHIESCESCKKLCSGESAPQMNVGKAFGKVKRQAQIFFAMIMMFGMFFGVSLTAGVDMFYNSLIMPAIGVVGYIIFRFKAVYLVPILLFITHGATNLLGLLRGVEHLDILSLIMWTIFYSIFAIIGIVIAALLHFAFKKESI